MVTRYQLPDTADLIRLGEPHEHAITVYAETPPGEYGLKLRGLAHTGSFIEGSPVVVGECFRPFVLRVN